MSNMVLRDASASKKLNQQLKSMLKLSENVDPYSKIGEKTRICKVCGKEGSFSNMKNHVEAKHIVGISVPCGLCGKLFYKHNFMHSFRHCPFFSIRVNLSFLRPIFHICMISYS